MLAMLPFRPAGNPKWMPHAIYSHTELYASTSLSMEALLSEVDFCETRELASLAPALAEQPQKEEEQVDDVNVDGNRSLSSAKWHFVSLA